MLRAVAMRDRDSRLRLISFAPAFSRALSRTRLTSCVVAALSLAAVLTGCAGDPPRIGERGIGIFVAPAWHPDGSVVLVRETLHGRSLLYDVKSGASRDMNIKDVVGWPVEFSSNGKFVFGTVGSSITAWEASSGRLAWRWSTGGNLSFACATGAALAIVVRREVVLLDAASGKAHAALEPEPYVGAQDAVCSPDRHFLARPYREGVVSVWDIAGREKVGLVRVAETDELYRIALGPRAEWLAVWAGERIRVFRRDTWSGPGQDLPPDFVPPAVELDVSLRASLSHGAISGNLFRFIRHGLVASPDGQYLALAGESKQSGWPAKYEQVVVNLDRLHISRLPPETGIDVAFSPDGTRLAIVGLGLKIWDIESGAFVTYPKR